MTAGGGKSRPSPGRTLVGWLGLLRDHDFRLLWIGETASAFGTNISRLALPLVAVVTLHATAFQVSLLTALTWLPWLLVGLPAGAWVDRLPRRPVMVICDGVSLLALASVPVAAWMHALTLAHLLAAALVAGAAAVFFETAYHVYLPGIVDQPHIPEANAKLQGSEAAAQIAGPGAAGLLTQAIGAVAGVLADALSFAVSALCLMSIRAPEQIPPAEPDHAREPLHKQIIDGLGFLLRDPYLRILTVHGALSNLALNGYQAILVVFLVRTVGANPATVGTLVAGMSVGGLLGAVAAPAIGRLVGSARGMLTANLVAGPFALLIPLTTPGPALSLVVIGGGGVGAAIVVGNVLKTSFRQTYTPRHLLGRVLVGMQFLNYGAIPIGATLSGSLASTIGLRTTVWIMVAALTAASLTLLIGPLKRQRDFPQQPVQQSTAPPA